MNLLNRLRHALLGRPQPKVTRLDSPDGRGMRIDELPPFNLHIAELMRYDPQIRIGLGARNGLLMAAEVDVLSEDRRLARWVKRQYESLWHAAAHQFLRAKLYGFLPFEVVYRRVAGGEFRGLVEVERLIDHHPRETRLLVARDKIVGFTYEAAEGSVSVGESESVREYGTAPAHTLSPSHTGTLNLFAPQALVCTFDAQSDCPYGCALLARAYPAWFEKWMPGGAKRTLRLRMIKDAYIGDMI